MARQSLSNMLGEGASLQVVPQPDHATKPTPPTATSDAEAEQKSQPAPPRTKPRAKKTPTRPAERSTTADEPKYLTLQRKEARLTDEQLDELTLLTRRLNKRRKGAGERITDNTLIRVAVDLLLQDTARLAGTTEEELRRSVGL